ncbi:MAG: urea ABC transporter permease subunit UrtB [Candidatus Competibacterales bacterium]
MTQSSRNLQYWVLLWALLWAVPGPWALGQEPSGSRDPGAFAEAVAALNAADFRAKERAILALAEAHPDHPRLIPILSALLEGDLYYRRSDDRVVFAERSGRGFTLTDPMDGASLGDVGRRGARRISVNNRLRGVLRTAIANLSLQHPDGAVRLAAVQRLIDDFDPAAAAALRQALAGEDDPAVREAMATGLALGELSDADPATRLHAVTTLAGDLKPEVRNRLNRQLEREDDPKVRVAIETALADIEAARRFYLQLETVFFGLSTGSVLFLAAIGLAITFGVMGVINMAHGELIMLGAYTAYGVQLLLPGLIDWSLLIALPAAFLLAGGVGVLIQLGVIRFLRSRPLETLLATFGLSLILQQTVRVLVSAQNVPVQNPSWMSGVWQVNSVLALTYNRLFILLFALGVFFALLLLLKRTTLGLQIRAVVQNRPMASGIGIRTGWVDALTFGLGAGIAGIAGVALSQLTNVGPNLGQSYIVDSFLVVVFGGVGSLWGTLVGAMGLGVINKFLEPVTGAVLAKVLVLVFIILFIQRRPRGLFPQRGRAAEG